MIGSDLRAGPEAIESMERKLADLLSEVQARDQSVQARLVSLLGITAVLSAAVTGVFALGAVGAGESLTTAQFVIVTTISIYIVIQLVGCLIATVRGLFPRKYMTMKAESIGLKAGESDRELRLRIVENERYIILTNTWTTDRRLDDMQIALDSLRNAVWGTLALVMVLAAIAFVTRFEWCICWSEL